MASQQYGNSHFKYKMVIPIMNNCVIWTFGNLHTCTWKDGLYNDRALVIRKGLEVKEFFQGIWIVSEKSLVKQASTLLAISITDKLNSELTAVTQLWLLCLNNSNAFCESNYLIEKSRASLLSVLMATTATATGKSTNHTIPELPYFSSSFVHIAPR